MFTAALISLNAIGNIGAVIWVETGFRSYTVLPAKKRVITVVCMMIEHNFHHSLNILKFRIVQKKRRRKHGLKFCRQSIVVAVLVCPRQKQRIYILSA